jgi:hypothetical protein
LPGSIGWAVLNWLPLNGFVVLCGPWGTGKSTLVLWLLTVLASLVGVPVDAEGYADYRGQIVPEYPTRFLGLPAQSTLNCVYLAIEQRCDLVNRVEAARIGCGLSRYPRAVYVSDGSLDLGDDDQVDDLVRQFDERHVPKDRESVLPAADVIVLDTVSAAMPKMAENTHEAISCVNVFADRLRKIRGGCLVIGVTHPPKQGEGVRGHGAFPGHVDVILKLTLEADGTMTLSQEKNNLGPHQLPIRFRKEVVERVRLDKIRSNRPLCASVPVRLTRPAFSRLHCGWPIG